jgi:hypothetical protein
MRAMSNSVGKQVRLTFRNNSPVLSGPFGKDEPETYDIEGTVLDGARHKGCYREDDEDKFFLSVPFTEVPIRVIDIKRVIAIDGVPVGEAQPKKLEQTWKVKSSRSDEVYTVKLFDGFWSCTCVANANFGKTCRHIKEIQDMSPMERAKAILNAPGGNAPPSVVDQIQLGKKKVKK